MRHLGLIFLLFAGLVNPGHAKGMVFGLPPEGFKTQIEQIATTCQCQLALGEDGLKQALVSEHDRPIVAAFITAGNFYSITSQFRTPVHVSALFDEPDPAKQVQLASVLLGKNRTVTFYSDKTEYLSDALDGKRLIKTSKPNLLNTLSRLDRYDAVVAVPNSDIWDRDTFRVVVRQLYLQKKVLIGFSKTLVNSGALASLYYSDEEYLAGLKALVSNPQISTDSVLRYPDNYKIAVNDRIAHSLDIVIPAEQELTDLFDKVSK